MFHKDPQKAFANAIKNGYLSASKEDQGGFGYAGDFMYMYSEHVDIVRGPDYLINGSCIRERDYFKHIDSRKYNRVPVWS